MKHDHRSVSLVIFMVGIGVACRSGAGAGVARAETARGPTSTEAQVRKSVATPAPDQPPTILPPAVDHKSTISPPTAGDRKSPPRTSQDRESAPATATARRSSENPAHEVGEARDCPVGMVLVDGDYCSKVEHDCEKSWYDESNKKTVCEKFAPHARCIGAKTKQRFCIDKYEWPNKQGERPEVMNKFHQAEVKCAAVGKRLCTESEWTMSCEGPKLLPFPYGFNRDTEICHGDVMWDSPNMHKVAERDPDELARLWKGVRSGSQPSCVSDYGVYDLTGNADEVVASETHTSDFRGKFDSVHTGGPWYKGVRNQCRPKIYTHDEGFYYYFLSFRCCAEPDGKSTDPRTPKQKKLNWEFERVERIAGFSREDVQKALAKKAKRSHCDCRPRDVRCNTICGTLLGPSAKDYPKTPKPKATGFEQSNRSGVAPTNQNGASPSHENGAPTTK
jgi:formylglycine-generating enzyme